LRAAAGQRLLAQQVKAVGIRGEIEPGKALPISWARGKPSSAAVLRLACRISALSLALTETDPPVLTEI